MALPLATPSRSGPYFFSRTDYFDHRHTMNTEKIRVALVDHRSPIGDFLTPTSSLVFLRTATLQNPRTPRGYCPCRSVGRGLKNCRQRFALCPGGTPQEISRGQARTAGAAPGCAAERAMPQRGIEEVFGGDIPAAFPPPPVASGHFLRCPVGAQSQMARFPGAASAEADLPPANLLRRPFGTRTWRPSSRRGWSVEVVEIFRRFLSISRTATGDRLRSALVAALPLCVHRVSVVLFPGSTQ